MPLYDLYGAEREIIEKTPVGNDFICFLGTLVDDWLEEHGFSFDDGFALLERLLVLREKVRPLLENSDPWYKSGGESVKW